MAGNAAGRNDPYSGNLRRAEHVLARKPAPGGRFVVQGDVQRAAEFDVRGVQSMVVQRNHEGRGIEVRGLLQFGVAGDVHGVAVFKALGA